MNKKRGFTPIEVVVVVVAILVGFGVGVYYARRPSLPDASLQGQACSGVAVPTCVLSLKPECKDGKWTCTSPTGTGGTQAGKTTTGGSGAGTNPSPTVPKQSSTTLTLTLRAQNNSNEKGTVKITYMSDRLLRVKISVTGGAPGVIQPANIRSGACSAPGSMLYILNPVLSGNSETDLPVAFADLKARAPYAVNIIKSSVESNIFVSCGDTTKP